MLLCLFCVLYYSILPVGTNKLLVVLSFLLHIINGNAFI